MSLTTLGRIALALATVVIVAIFYVPLGHDNFAGTWGDATYGVAAGRGAGSTVTAVQPGLPGARAGIRAGDRIVAPPFSSLSFALAYPRAGDVRDFTLEHPDGTLYRVTLHAVPVPGFTARDRILGMLAILPATIFIAIAFALVFVRPSVMTWSFFGYAAGYFSTGPVFQFFSGVLDDRAFTVLSFLLWTVFGNFSVLLLVPFLIRFPDDRLAGFRRSLERAVWIAIAAAFALDTFSWHSVLATGAEPAFGVVLDTWLPLSTFVFASFVLAKKYALAQPQTRQRFGFLMLGLAISFIAYAAYFVPGISFATKQIVGYGVVIMPICVAYAVLRHRVLDVNFVLNRALAYGILSVIVIAFISLLDWFFSRIVAEQHLAVLAELGVTICVGLLLDRINKGVERVVETVFFRKRRAAEEYVRRAAQALPYATRERAVNEGVVDVPAEAFHLAGAAHYRRSGDGSRFEGVATSANALVAPAGFDGNHLLVRMLQASEERVWLEDLRAHLDAENSRIYVVAVPVTVRHELVSFTLYGAHENGAQLDPEEIELLEDLAREAARAYDHIEAVRARERYAALTMQPSRGTA
ncbi:MAG: hypothetical protein KGN02_02250 [bacterium]|nr:hypothetical protein [bacterium]